MKEGVGRDSGGKGRAGAQKIRSAGATLLRCDATPLEIRAGSIEVELNRRI